MNFNTLVSAIQLELNDYTSRSKTRIEKWVNECHKMICQSRRWNFLIVRESDEITIGQADVPVNIETGIRVNNLVVAAQNILSIHDVTDGTYKYVKQTTFDQLRDSFQADSFGVPEFWYFSDNNKIKFFPILQEDRKFIFSFQKKIVTYTSGATIALLIPDEFIDVLHELVLYKAYRYKTDDRASACLENYNAMLESMTSAESNKLGIIYDHLNTVSGKLPLLVDDS